MTEREKKEICKGYADLIIKKEQLIREVWKNIHFKKDWNKLHKQKHTQKTQIPGQIYRRNIQNNLRN